LLNPIHSPDSSYVAGNQAKPHCHNPAEQFNIIISVVKQWFDMLSISHIMELCLLAKLADDGLRCDYWAE